MFNKLPGGEADGMSPKDFSKQENKAIDKGSKIEASEHGKTAPKEIAADHVVEHGAKYYNDKTGLPAMEKKMESKMKKANPNLKPAEMSVGMKVAYDPNLPTEEHIARVKMHNHHAALAAREGNRGSSIWHHQQAYKHHLAAIGKAPGLPTHTINTIEKAEKDYAPKVEEKEPMEKSIQYASGQLSKSIKSDCKDCGARQHQQWSDTAKKSESCKKCGTPMKKSGMPEEMPDSVKKMSKAENAVNSAEAEELEKTSVVSPAPVSQSNGTVQPDVTTSKWSDLLNKAKGCLGKLPSLKKEMGGVSPMVAPPEAMSQTTQSGAPGSAVGAGMNQDKAKQFTSGFRGAFGGGGK